MTEKSFLIFTGFPVHVETMYNSVIPQHNDTDLKPNMVTFFFTLQHFSCTWKFANNSPCSKNVYLMVQMRSEQREQWQHT